MALQYDRQLTISSAGSRTATQWPKQHLYWSELIEKLKTAVRGSETLEEYLNMSKREQDDLKDVGGFVAGELKNNRRKASNVISRSVITLDMDNIPAGGTDDVLRRLEGLGCAYVTYSTRKHQPSVPRLRVIVPFDRPVTPDEYEPAARKLASIIGISMADPTTFEASRLMYWPSCSVDSHYVFQYADRQFLSADGVLSMYSDWHDIQEWPEVPGARRSYKRMASKQGNPQDKKGVVGAFCRTYDIYSAIDTFLPGVYTETDTPERLTFVDGTTVGGAIVYDDGDFLYSHHATDPVSGKLVNAFDLVRLHKYSDEDDDAKQDTPVSKLPSYASMSSFALNDAGVADILNQDRYNQALADFADTPEPETTGEQETDDDDGQSWIRELKIQASGNPEKTVENILIALNKESYLKGRIKLDMFAETVIGIAPLPWAPRNKQTGRFTWTDDDDSGLLLYLEKILGFMSKEKTMHALSQCAAINAFNPVTDYLDGLTWDGTPRLDTLFVDYLGAEDSEYTRAVTRKAFTAAVARAKKPGIKHDTMPVLTGPQGVGKSTLLSMMGKAWFTDALETFEGKDAAELLQGVWIVEIGEMSAYGKSDLNTIKGFLSRTEDLYRAAYARRTEQHPRCCVFFGTSNRSDYLKDPTGARRFLPIDVSVNNVITKSVFRDLPDEVDQLWAEATQRYRESEPLTLPEHLSDDAKQQQEDHEEQDPWESIIQEFIERPVPEDWGSRSVSDRCLYWSGEFGKESDANTVERHRVCAAEIWCELFNKHMSNMKRSDTIRINNILSNLDGWEKNKNPIKVADYGRVKGVFYRAY